MKQVSRHFVAALLLAALLSPPALAALEIIELRHRPAAELAPLLAPLLGADTVLRPDGYRLIVRGSAADVAELRRLVARLDTAARNLLISVRSVRRSVHERASDSLAIELGPRDASVELDLRRHATRERSDNGFQVRTLEGQAAYVSAGEQRATRRREAQVIGGHLVGVPQGGPTSARSGLWVRPHVRGEQVVLEVATSQQALAADAPARSTRGVVSEISGPLGRWLLLGGVERVSSGEARGPGGRQTRTGSDGFVTEIKVELLP